VFRKALIPIDGSDVAEAALDAARAALPDDAEVLLVEVVDTVAQIIAHTTPAGFGYGSFDASIVSEVVEAQHRDAQGHLEAAAARLREQGLAKVSTSILEGRPGDLIVDTAAQGGFDLIVMGTHGRSGLFRTVLGSVAEHVVRHVRGVPVLLVHPAARD
jgi:nucleotide-binding universal stress UspA family protein